MAIIHKTTLVPGKLDLLAGWMPAQPWYAGRDASRRWPGRADSGSMTRRERSESSSWW